MGARSRWTLGAALVAVLAACSSSHSGPEASSAARQPRSVTPGVGSEAFVRQMLNWQPACEGGCSADSKPVPGSARAWCTSVTPQGYRDAGLEVDIQGTVTEVNNGTFVKKPFHPNVDCSWKASDGDQADVRIVAASVSGEDDTAASQCEPAKYDPACRQISPTLAEDPVFASKDDAGKPACQWGVYTSRLGVNLYLSEGSANIDNLKRDVTAWGRQIFSLLGVAAPPD